MSPTPKILVFMTHKGPIQQGILTGLKSHLTQHVPNARIEERNSNGVHEDRIRQSFEEINDADVSLVVTIGEQQTCILLEHFKHHKLKTPVIACAISKQTRKTISERAAQGERYITGIYAKYPDNVLPLQLVLKAIGYGRRLLLLCRSTKPMGRITYDVSQIMEYFKARGIIVTCIDLHDLSSLQDIQQAVKKNDAVVVPEGGVTIQDAEDISQICQEENTLFFGDGQALAGRGAVYGFKIDFRRMGAEVSHVVCEILIDKKLPHQIPLREAPHTRRINTVDTKTMAQCGVFIADDVVASLEGDVGSDELPTFVVGMSSYAQTAYSFSLQMSIWQRLMKEKDMCYIVHPYDAQRDNSAFMESHITYLSTRNLHAMVYFDDQLAHLVWQEAQNKNISLPPMVVIALKDESIHPEWHTQARAQGLSLTSITIPAINPLAQFHMLHESVRGLKKMMLVVNAIQKSLPDHLSERIALLRAECMRRDIELKVVGGPSFDDMHHVASSLKPGSADAVMFYQDAFCARIGAHLIRRCDELDIPVCAGGMMWAQIAPLCYGVDMLNIREVGYNAIDAYTNPDDAHTQNDTIVLSEKDAYGFSFNQRLCHKHNLRFSQTAQLLATFQHYDMMHERNIAACMEAVGVDETGEPLMQNVPQRQNTTHN